jgi:HD-like signal output (HDOD) protein
MAAVRHPNRLPLQPLTAVAVLRSADKPELAAATLARLVEVDPALSAMVLRVANAPLFGFGGRVASARQASLLLGTRTVGSLAVGATASLVFGTGSATSPEDAKPTDGCWSHAVATACASAVIARLLGVNPEEAFTAGLLHNAAWLVPADCDTDGACDGETSADLLRDWGLPPSLVRAVRAHGAAPGAISDPLSRSLAIGHAIVPAVDAPTPQALAAARDTFQEGGLPPSRIDETLAAIRRELDSIVTLIAEEAS